MPILHCGKRTLKTSSLRSLLGIMVLIAPLYPSSQALARSSYTHHHNKHYAPTQTQQPPQNTNNPEELNITQSAIIRDVLASALNFMLPRTLEIYSAKQLCLWGINGISMIDPAFNIQHTTLLKDKTQNPPQKARHLTIFYQKDIILDRTMPEENDLKAWTSLTLAFIQTAWTHSDILRSNGEDALLPTFFNEVFNHLDPYSRYLNPNDAHTERTDRQGDSFSVGLTLQRHNNSTPTISSINVNSPAWDQGVDIGQTLLNVNGHKTENAPLHLIYRWLYGKPNSFVTLTLKDNSGKIYTCTLRRQALPPETVTAKHIEHYLILKISRFSAQTAEEISQYISSEMPNTPNKNGDSLDEDPPTGTLPGLILDLRGNHGGVLQQAVITAALFLNNGIAATTEGRNPAANHIWGVQGGDITNNSPIIVLVDGQTASAAEVLAAALADHQRAVIIGSNTLGKGLVQIIGQMPNESEIFITWSRNLAPLGWPIQNLGVMPQICTSSGRNSLTEQLRALKKGKNIQAPLLHQSRMMRDPLALDKVLALRQHCPASLGTENDLTTALHILHSPISYQTALHSVIDETSSPAALH